MVRVWFAGCFVASLIGLAWLTLKFGITVSGLALGAGWAAVAALIVVGRSDWRIVAGTGLATRIVVRLLAGPGSPTSADALNYDLLAHSYAKGHDAIIVVGGTVYQAVVPPLYPHLLGLAYWAGGNAIVFNGLIDALTAFVIYRIVRVLGGQPSHATIAAGLYFVWPHVMVLSLFASKEGLASLFLLCCVLLVALMRRDGRNRGVLYGICAGLLGLTQPAIVLVALAMLLVLYGQISWKAHVRVIAFAALAFIAVLMPWWLRNWAVTGGFIPLTSSQGANLYVNAAQSWQMPPGTEAMPEPERSKALMKAGWAVITSEPLGFAVRQAKAVFLAFGLEHEQLINLSRYSPPTRLQPRAFLIPMQLSLVGLWACTASIRRNVILTRILLISIAHTLVVSIWFEFAARHRGYFVPLALIAILTGTSYPWRKSLKV